MESKMAAGKEVRELRHISILVGSPWNSITTEEQNQLVKEGFCFPDGEWTGRYCDPFDKGCDFIHPYFTYGNKKNWNKEHIEWVLINFNVDELAEFFCHDHVSEAQKIDKSEESEMIRLLSESLNNLSTKQPDEYKIALDKMVEVCKSPCISKEVIKCIQVNH
jgi:hypothetical protein